MMSSSSLGPAASAVQIEGVPVGPGHPCFIIGEIGINHNGDIAIAKKLIDVAKAAGCQAVKFQKRSIEIVYTKDELDKPRESPFGTRNEDLKRGLEFSLDTYREIDRYCRKREILWLASCWDEFSVDFIDAFPVPCYKIASASLTDDHLLKYTRAKAGRRPILLSTGMSTVEQIDHALEILGRENLVLIHTTSTYPAYYDELNLKCIPWLSQRYGVPVGYSGHETGLASSTAAVALGACVVERHITLDRAMWGSDQAASLEPGGLTRLVRDIRLIETALGDGVKRVFEREKPVLQKLRRI
jgi:N-acetylneuraminate synthase